MLTITEISTASSGYTATRSPGTGTFASYTAFKNDLILTWVAATTVAAATTPSTLVNVYGGNTVIASDSHTVFLGYHLVTDAEAGSATSWTWTNLWNATATGNCMSLALRGVDATNPIDTSSSTFNSGNTTTPHVMPGVSGADVSLGSWLISGLATPTTNSYGAAPGGWTFRKSTSTNQLQAAYSKNALMVPGTTVADQNLTPTTGDEFVGTTVVLTALNPLENTSGNSVAVRRANFY